MKTLQCEMKRDCVQPVTHIEEKGFIYCKEHGVQRRYYGRRCRALRPWELAMLRQGLVLPSYEPRPKSGAIDKATHGS